MMPGGGASPDASENSGMAWRILGDWEGRSAGRCGPNRLGLAVYSEVFDLFRSYIKPARRWLDAFTIPEWRRYEAHSGVSIRCRLRLRS